MRKQERFKVFAKALYANVLCNEPKIRILLYYSRIHISERSKCVTFIRKQRSTAEPS